MIAKIYEISKKNVDPPNNVVTHQRVSASAALPKSSRLPVAATGEFAPPPQVAVIIR
jgi:hypothetical protein